MSNKHDFDFSFIEECQINIGNRGWICPKCGKVYAPDVKECSICNYLANINASGRINQSPSTETRPQDVTATMNTQEECVGICEEGQND